MGMTNSVMAMLVPHWISFGMGLCLLFLPFLSWQEGTASRLMAGGIVALAMIQCHAFVGALGLASLPVLLLHELALYCVAPLLFLGIEALIGNAVSARRLALHLSPLAGIAVLALQQLQHPGLLQPLQKLVYAASFAAGSFYALRVLRRLSRFAHPAGLMRMEALLLSLVIATGLGTAFIVMLGVVLGHPYFYAAYGSAITTLMVLAHLLRMRYPGLAQLVSDELREAAAAEGLATEPGRRSQLTGIDIEARLAALRRSMEEEHLYRRDDLGLAQLATALGLSSHQLSELVNEHLGLNFSRFLKQYRVADAKRLLVEKPSMSVLEVGMNAGFNSLSAFYSAFRELEGMAPGVYRKQQRGTPSPQ